MSFGNQKVFNGIQEILFLALMLVTFFALFYLDIGLVYKISIGAITFTVIFLTTLSAQIFRQQKEAKQANPA